MYDLNSIPVLLAVAETLSFTQAANRLHMTKSSVSKIVNTAEEQLGVKLFSRSTRKISLTEIGETYIQYIQTSFSYLEQGKNAISQLNVKAAGKLKICAPMSFGTLHLSKVLPEFLKRYPDLQIELILEDKVTDLIAEGYDLTIRIGELADSALFCKKLTRCHSVLCASENYLQKQGIPTSLTDLKQHNCLFYSFYQAGREWQFYKNNLLEKFSPSGNFIVNNSESLLQAVIQDIGITLLPYFIAMPYLKSGVIKPILMDYTLPEHFIYAVYPNKSYLPHKTRLAIDFLYEKFNEMSEYSQQFETL